MKMRIRYFTDKNAAGAQYDALALSGIKCVLTGPVDEVKAPTADGNGSYVYTTGGGIYVLLSEVSDTVASFDVTKYVPPAKPAGGS